MKRRIMLKLAVFLLLGAIINVAVAWGCATCFDIYSNRYRWIEPIGLTYEYPTSEQIRWRVGFPMRGLHCVWNRNGNAWVAEGCLVVPTPLPDALAFKGDQAHLPVGLIPLGFAINTIFYAAVLWLLIAAPFKLRRYIRIKRQGCPACGYPVGTSPVCTECGVPVTRTPVI